MVAQQTIRKAMGISYEPTASESSVETQNVVTSVSASQMTANKQQELDTDVNDFFAQGTSTRPIVL